MMEIKRTDLELIEGYPKSDGRNRIIYFFRKRDPATNKIIGYVASVPEKFLVISGEKKKEVEEKITKELIPDTHPFNGAPNMDINETASIYKGHISEIYVKQNQAQQQTQQETKQQTK